MSDVKKKSADPKSIRILEKAIMISVVIKTLHMFYQKSPGAAEKIKEFESALKGLDPPDPNDVHTAVFAGMDIGEVSEVAANDIHDKLDITTVSPQNSTLTKLLLATSWSP